MNYRRRRNCIINFETNRKKYIDMKVLHVKISHKLHFLTPFSCHQLSSNTELVKRTFINHVL